MNRFVRLAALITSGSLTALSAPAATGGSVAIRDSFRIGSSGVLCTAQVRPADAALSNMFDRGYAIVCRDAAASVGELYALRNGADDPVARIAGRRPSDLECQAPAPATVEGLSGVMLTECTSGETGVRYRSYTVSIERTTYIAQGLGGYDSALTLGLRTLVADRAVEGEVEAATTSAGDPAAFARVQAGALDTESALSEAYLRNNSGSYAEASEFFETLSNRAMADTSAARVGEFLVNRALQQSNLGNFAAADLLFARAERSGARDDIVQSRLLRNYRALHELNQRHADRAIAALDQPVVEVGSRMGDRDLAGGVISQNLADMINRENASLERLGGVDSRLRPEERALILDGQALQLRGVALRLQRKYPEALQALAQAERSLGAVRDGKIAAAAFLRSDSLTEMASISEAQGDQSAAERQLTEAVQLFSLDYPQSAAELSAKARLAGYLARHGQDERALTLFGEVVEKSQQTDGSITTLQALLVPYFDLLASRMGSDPHAAEAFFAGSQVLVRSGLAQTQAVLARELSSGDDEASALFRQSINQSRDIARTTGEIARLSAPDASQGRDAAATLATARERLATLERNQTALLSRLASYPRYRVLAPQALTLAELQAALREGEAYYQLRIVRQNAYAMLITKTSARAVKLGTTARALENSVDKIRHSIVYFDDDGAPVTEPFNLVEARKLYEILFGGFDAPLDHVTNLIFEPDGALLQLPPNLLVTDQASVTAYAARAGRSDPYDFTGVKWLGRDRDVTTAVSPRSFVDVRQIPASRGEYAYLGLGENAVPNRMASFFSVSAPPPPDACAWPSEVWEKPISPAELFLASRIVGEDKSQVITGSAFSDTAILARDDLNKYRVIHFATHGLVTAPRPECPARPALLTSFGSGASDGLLTFKEIYDLHLDADVVVLSACDTAGAATIEATREAGITSGGNYALDGLVRAFVGAGARTVVASHWPVPDDYNATQRLILGLFNAPRGTAVAGALRTTQRELMDQAATSHPYYWSAFAVVGDGERAMLSTQP